MKHVNGWFALPGRPGDRTFQQQLLGLDWLFANCKGKTVLDVGCAEGLIALELVGRHGAAHAHGVELVPGRVKMAQKLASRRYLSTLAKFEVGDMDVLHTPPASYDIVIGLAILHKLKQPSKCATMLARATKHAVVFRLPPTGAPVIVDRRSGHVPHDIGAVMVSEGFTMVESNFDGPYGEYVGVWVRS